MLKPAVFARLLVLVAVSVLCVTLYWKKRELDAAAAALEAPPEAEEGSVVRFVADPAMLKARPAEAAPAKP